MHAKQHEKLDLLKLSVGERIICVQRQHWTILVFPLLFALFVLILVSGASILLFAQKLIVIPPLGNAFLLHLFLFILGGVIVFETYTYLFWFYQFYIITNKRIAHRRHFTFGGRHIDEVFLEATPVKEIIRDAQNPLFDMLQLEDVYIYFQRLERPDPFIFKKPEDAREIETIMEKAAVKKLD